MEKSNNIQFAEELTEEDIYVCFDATPVVEDNFLEPLRTNLKSAEEDFEETAVVANLGLTFAEFDALLNRALKNQKKAGKYIPNIISHLGKLVRVLEMHQRELVKLGFKIFDFVKKVTDLFVSFKRRLSRGMTIFELMLSWLESITLSKTKEADKYEFLELVKKKVQDETRTMETMRENVQHARQKYDKDEVLKKIEEAEKAAKTMPKITKILKMAAACLTSGAAFGAGATTIATAIPALGGPGLLVLGAISFPPLLVGIVIAGVLSAATAVTGAAAYASKLSRQQEQLVDRLQYFETMFVVCHELLNVMEEDMDNIINTLHSLDMETFKGWIEKTTDTTMENKPLESLKRTLYEINEMYSTTYKNVSFYDKMIVASNGYLEGPFQSTLAGNIRPIEYEQKNPEWQEDKAVPACNLCKATFNLLRRRHHCRICLKIFCDNCSSHRVETKASPKLVRACNPCAMPLEAVAKTPEQILEELRRNLEKEDLV